MGEGRAAGKHCEEDACDAVVDRNDHEQQAHARTVDIQHQLQMVSYTHVQYERVRVCVRTCM